MLASSWVLSFSHPIQSISESCQLSEHTCNSVPSLPVHLFLGPTTALSHHRLQWLLLWPPSLEWHQPPF